MTSYDEQETMDGAAPSTDAMSVDEAFELAVGSLADAKAAEAKAQAARIAAEQAVLAFVQSKDEGSVTRAASNYKVTVTYPVNRTIDAPALESVRAALDPAVFDQVIAYKPALQLPGLRAIQAANPAAYSLLAQAITARPGKPSVKLELNTKD